MNALFKTRHFIDTFLVVAFQTALFAAEAVLLVTLSTLRIEFSANCENSQHVVQ